MLCFILRWIMKWFFFFSNNKTQKRQQTKQLISIESKYPENIEYLIYFYICYNFSMDEIRQEFLCILFSKNFYKSIESNVRWILLNSLIRNCELRSRITKAMISTLSVFDFHENPENMDIVETGTKWIFSVRLLASVKFLQKLSKNFPQMKIIIKGILRIFHSKCENLKLCKAWK